ncbi:MAG: hypothetical protein GAK30_01922 [Paracidovorax wautersii]|uniref:Type IV pilus assembly protein PilO n=1 Tax=Paracidovorax wautersii TaxID=1177982 RepID=A0A7V8FP03_9BURK|nr:MAG: hypothetical protein GAK30_01922 [Paracidovorax wautersii]
MTSLDRGRRQRQRGAFVSQFRQLDLADLPAWPPWPRALLCTAFGLLAALVVGGLCLPGALAEREATHLQAMRWRADVARKQAQAGELGRLTLARRQIDQAVAELQALLPTPQETEALLSMLHGAAQRHGLSAELFRPGEAAASEDAAGEQTIALRLVGPYHGLGGFLADVARLPPLVVLRDLAIVPGRDGALVLDATTRTYRSPPAVDRAGEGRR